MSTVDHQAENNPVPDLKFTATPDGSHTNSAIPSPEKIELADLSMDLP
jgi:hypothetical protein